MDKRQLMNMENIKQNEIISESVENTDQEQATEKKSKKAGFTLIELIVVVAVIAVLVGSSVGSLVSVQRRKATKVGKLIDSELSILASHAYSRDGDWRLAFTRDADKDCLVVTHEYKADSESPWLPFESISFDSNVEISFGGDEYDSDNKLDDGAVKYVAVSREKGHYRTDSGYFCDKIFVHSASKVVTIEMSPESGGHRIVD